MTTQKLLTQELEKLSSKIDSIVEGVATTEKHLHRNDVDSYRVELRDSIGEIARFKEYLKPIIQDALLYRSLTKAHVAKELGVATEEQLREIELFLLSARYEACSIVGGS